MTTDFRALCAELLAEIDEAAWGIKSTPLSPAINRARAALAEGDGVEVTDEELLAAQDQGVASFPPLHPEAQDLSAVEYARELEVRKARAVLARYGTTHPRPIPVGERLPTAAEATEDGEVWVIEPATCYPLGDTGDWDDMPAMATLRRIGRNDAIRGLTWLPAAAIPLPEATP